MWDADMKKLSNIWLTADPLQAYDIGGYYTCPHPECNPGGYKIDFVTPHMFGSLAGISIHLRYGHKSAWGRKRILRWILKNES